MTLHHPATFLAAGSLTTALLDAAIKGAFLLVLATLITTLLARRSAASRHAVWTAAMVGLLLLPVFSLLLPGRFLAPLALLPSDPNEAANSTPAAEPTTTLPSDQSRDRQAADESHRAIQPTTATLPSDQSRDRQGAEESHRAIQPTTAILPSDQSRDRQGAEESHRAIQPTPPSQSSTHPSTQPRSWSSILLTVWLVGLTACFLSLLTAAFSLNRLAARAAQITRGPWLESFDEARRQAETAPVLLLETEAGGMPLACGILAPTLLLPGDAASWPQSRRRVVLEHELAHVRRRDCFTQLLAAVACSVHWFNPIAWFALRQMRVERERACDDAVVRAGADPAEYASHLLEIARSLRAARCGALAGVAMARPSQLEGRLLAVLDRQKDHRPVSPTFLTAGAAGFCVALALLASVRIAPAQQSLTRSKPTADAPAKPEPAKPVPTPVSTLAAEKIAAAPSSKAEAAPAAEPLEKPFADIGEELQPAGKSSEGPLQARDSDSFYKLSNARIEHGPRPWPTLAVDYDRVHSGAHNGQILVVRQANGQTQSYILIGPFFDKTGTIRIDFHIGGPFNPGPPKDAELYLTRQDLRYAKWNPTFKVSNSTVLGTMKDLTLARQWTAQEADRLAKPPPDYTNPNAHPEIGRDTEFAGKSTGGVTLRYLSPDHPLLGIEYRIGEWEKEKCIAQLVPVFADDQPTSFEPRLIAKDGYAVGAMNVNVGKFVTGVQLIYFKLKPDNTLDPADNYTSDWAGDSNGGTITKLTAEGKRVLGINCRTGAILDGIALVKDAPLRH